MILDSTLEALAALLAGHGTAAAGLGGLRQLFDAMPIMVGLLDREQRLLFANRAYLSFAGRTLQDLQSGYGEVSAGEDGAPGERSILDRVLGGETVQVEGWVTHPLGGQTYMMRVLAPHRSSDGTVVGYFALMQDLTDRRQFQDDLFRLAYYDPVTGLANRQLLLKHVADYLGIGDPFFLVILDIDRFTDIRTSLGQAFANELLADIAERLGQQGGAADLLARVSDHAFAILLSGTDRPALEARLAGLSGLVRAARSRSGGAVFLSASIGVAEVSALHGRPEEVLRDAEIATSRAREGGGARHVWFDPAMHAKVVEQVSLEHDLRRALERGEGLWLAYQPIVEMVTGGLAGFEALARWQHPERGNLPPGLFIPIAESTGLVVALGAWVLREACRQLAEWQDRRMPGTAPLFMSVNLSTRQLGDPHFPDMVRDVLRETGVDPSWLKLEITESAVMEKAEQAIRVLAGLRRLGIKLSIDDFGTGYSSLSYLHRLPIDSLKVDRSFVSAMHQSEENRAIVRIIIDLARILGFDVIAEGIETMADANLLRALGCDYGQGYHFAKPLPTGQAEPMVAGTLPWRDGEAFA